MPWVQEAWWIPNGVLLSPPDASEIKVHPIKSSEHVKEAWISPYISRIQALAPNGETAVMQTRELPASPAFIWELNAKTPLEIFNSLALRVISVGSSRLIEPLEKVKVDSDEDDPDFVRFAVPKCEKGDKLFVILSLRTTREQMPEKPLSFISGNVLKYNVLK
jgi:hypothetical protein